MRRTPIPLKTKLIDERTGLISRVWGSYFDVLDKDVGSVTLSWGYTIGETFNAAELKSALNLYGSTDQYMLILRPGVWTIDDNVTVGANVTLVLYPGVVLRISNEKTLLVNGRLDAGLYQVFSCYGTGKVIGLKEVYPEWFGARRIGSNNDYSALYNALVSLQPNGGDYILAADTYLLSQGLVTDSINWLGPVHIKGKGRASTVLQDITGSGRLLWMDGPDGSSVKDLHLLGKWDGSSLVVGHTGLFIGNNSGRLIHDITVDNVESSYFGYDSFNFFPIQRLTLTNLYGHHSYNESILIGNETNNYTLAHSTFELSRFMVDLGNSWNGSVDDITINRALDAWATCGLTIERTHSSYPTGNITVSNSRFNDVGDICINISGVDAVKNITLSDNILKVNTSNDEHWGIGITVGYSENVTISGGEIVDCQSTSVGSNLGNAIWLLNSPVSHLTISDIDFHNIEGYALQLGQAGGTNTFTDVSFLINRIKSVGGMVASIETVNKFFCAGNTLDTATYCYNFASTPTNSIFGINYLSNVTTEVTGTAPISGIIHHLNQAGCLQVGSFWPDEESDIKVRSFGTNYTFAGVGNTSLGQEHFTLVTAAGTTVTLPDADLCYGRLYLVKQSGDGSIVVTPTDGTIDGAATFTLRSNGEVAVFQSSGASGAWSTIFSSSPKRNRVSIVASTYTILVSDETVVCNKSTDFTVTLPATLVGQRFTIENINTGIVTVEGAGSDTINGSLNIVLAQYDSVTVECFYANMWEIVSEYKPNHTTVITNTYSVLSTDKVVICNKVTAFTVTLPVAVVGMMFYIKNINVGTVTLAAQGADTIDGVTTQTLGQWDSITVYCYAANSWVIL